MQRKRENSGLGFTETVHCVHMYTVKRIIKLNLFPVPVRLHPGSGKLTFCRNFTMFDDI